MRLYHLPGSRSNRVLWALEESGEPFEVTQITGAERKEPAHLARHPLGRVPAVEDERGPIFESAAICLHIADLNPDARLNWPLGSHERALAYQWTLYAMTELEPPCLAIWSAERASDEQAEEAGREDFRTAARVVEDALAEGEYLVGGRFSIADLMCADVLGWGKDMDGLLDGLPAVQAYLERLEARPAYQRAIPTAV